MMLFAAAILCLHQNVSAAEGATVTVNGDTLQAGSDAWKVTLDISGDTKITNGKIRVTYDSSQLKLVSTEAGSMMNGVLTDINDPVSGNKSEGEAVFVFASSTELDTNGTLFEMTFQVQDSVKDGDSVTVSAKTEELQNNNAAVAVTDVPLNAAVGRQSNNNGSRKTFAHLHPAASQPHIFGLKLQVDGSNGGIFYPHIACQRVGNNHYSQCRIGNELRCLLLAIGQFLQFILLVHHYELPCIATLRRGCHQSSFHQSDDLFLCQFFFCKLPHAAAGFYQFTETFHNIFVFSEGKFR